MNKAQRLAILWAMHAAETDGIGRSLGVQMNPLPYMTTEEIDRVAKRAARRTYARSIRMLEGALISRRQAE